MSAYLLDTETNIGPKEGTPECIELAWVKLNEIGEGNGTLLFVDEGESYPYVFQRYFQPSQPISIEALAVHHISNEKLSRLTESFSPCITSEDAAGFLPKDLTYMVGHNIDFDYGVLGEPENIKLIDTLTLCRKLAPSLTSHSQNTMMYYVESLRPEPNYDFITEIQTNAHSAKQDILNLQLILDWILFKLTTEHGCKSWEDIYQLCELWRIPTEVTFGIHNGKKWSEVPKDYLRWMLTADFDKYTVIAVKQTLGIV